MVQYCGGMFLLYGTIPVLCTYGTEILNLRGSQYGRTGFAICGLGHRRNLRICDLKIDQKKFANSKFADSHTSEICGFSIRIEPKNLRIYDLRT
jgi:hypothetical protein